MPPFPSHWGPENASSTYFELLDALLLFTVIYSRSANMAKLQDWQKVCKIPDSCTFVWDGYGRWIKDQWKPYDESGEIPRRSGRGGGVLNVVGNVNVGLRSKLLIKFSIFSE